MSQIPLHQYITIENKINVATNAGGNDMSKVKVINLEYMDIKVQIKINQRIVSLYNCSESIPVEWFTLQFLTKGKVSRNVLIFTLVENLDWSIWDEKKDFTHISEYKAMRECLYSHLPTYLQDNILLCQLLEDNIKNRKPLNTNR